MRPIIPMGSLGGVLKVFAGLALGVILAVVPIGISYFEPHYTPFIAYLVLAVVGYQILHWITGGTDEGAAMGTAAVTSLLAGCCILAAIWFLAV